VSAVDLYEEDFYLWTQAQADALRAEARRARGGGSNVIDRAHLAEEVADLGARDVRECFSRIRTILEHLWKLEASQMDAPRLGCTETILTQRTDLQDALTPSIRRMMEARLEEAHARASANAETSLRLHEAPALSRLDASRRWTLPQILGEADDPLRTP
jgi:hypothetical protein